MKIAVTAKNAGIIQMRHIVKTNGWYFRKGPLRVCVGFGTGPIRAFHAFSIKIMWETAEWRERKASLRRKKVVGNELP